MLRAVAQLRCVARMTLLRMVWILVGSVLLATGMGFVAAAVWIMLAQAFGSLVAMLTLGGIFAGLGLIVIGLASAMRPPAPPKMADVLRQAGDHGALFQPRGDLPPLVEAFLVGLTTSLQARAQQDRK